ncbi:Shedu anti-phage system protein SduA domain-containing protein [Arthrobacter silvisoli]|uniref:Shedu anti-phage system protein SduA domain-containing protein n=1 Tax=Arthrobacter silvisoli TaxID=2291022 RepID=UPI0014440F91|nr:Shedu anti-phage system protein SduA domain-containing protein [Arthrobacter silvisoli]
MLRKPFDEGSDEPDEEFDFDGEDTDVSGRLILTRDGAEFVLTYTGNHRDAVPYEALRHRPDEKLLRIFPTVELGGIKEFQVELPWWSISDHSEENDRFFRLQVARLPKGFNTIYAFGLGINKSYKGFIREIEDHTTCTIVRFVQSGEEGISTDGTTYCVTLERFERFRAAVERNRGRGQTAVQRVNDAEAHNAFMDLLHSKRVDPKYTKHKVIREITEEVATGHVTTAEDRIALAGAVSEAAPKIAQEDPQRLVQLRDDLELVSLDTLIAEFESNLEGSKANSESHWQKFFGNNHFALQLIFSTPLVVEMEQATVKSQEADGSGARIADFLCVNPVTRSIVLVEIKTPGAKLMRKTPYRGKGTGTVHSPDDELVGPVAQVQSQMASASESSFTLFRGSDFDSVNEPRGAVITGKVSSLTTQEQRDSFSRYRAGLSNVTVLTFDEVLERLKHLRKAFNTHR